MKTTSSKLAFGFSVVNAGQRKVEYAPEVIALSTQGGFKLTPAVTAALGIQSGDYAMFISTVPQVDAAIATKADVYLEFCNANGLDAETEEAAIAFRKANYMWAIAKGIVEYDTKGNQKTTSERLTKNDKIKFASQNFDEMLADAMENADDETKEALSRDGITKEEQIDILAAFVTPRELPKYKGSKAANPAGLTGAGTSLTFTDSNVWKQLKADMGDDATKLNRVFDVDVEELQDIELNNGYKTVTVKALVLGDFTDKEPARIGKGGEEE